MGRSSDESIYDYGTLPLIPYKSPLASYNLTEEQFDKIDSGEMCAQCLSHITTFKDSFTMDAGQSGTFEVTGDSRLCKRCFDELRNNQPTYRKVARVKINYAFGTEELQTIEDME